MSCIDRQQALEQTMDSEIVDILDQAPVGIAQEFAFGIAGTEWPGWEGKSAKSAFRWAVSRPVV
jgi:hypothetical protein